MPLDLNGGATIASDKTFQARVAMAFYFVARQVMTEPNETNGHEVRESFARSVVTQDLSQFQKLAAVIVTDPSIVQASPTLQTAITDGQIIQAVTTVWNKLSGIR